MRQIDRWYLNYYFCLHLFYPHILLFTFLTSWLLSILKSILVHQIAIIVIIIIMLYHLPLSTSARLLARIYWQWQETNMLGNFASLPKLNSSSVYHLVWQVITTHLPPLLVHLHRLLLRQQNRLQCDRHLPLLHPLDTILLLYKIPITSPPPWWCVYNSYSFADLPHTHTHTVF